MGIEVEYQRALFTVLNANKATLGLSDVYDIAPQDSDGGSNAAFPYATIGTIFMVQNDTQSKDGQIIASRIHVHSRTGSMMETKTIQGKIFGLLHRGTLSITGHNNFSLLRTDTDCFGEGGSRVHGVCEYTALTETS